MDLSQLEHQPTLLGRSVRLEPMGPEHFDGLWPMYAVSPTFGEQGGVGDDMVLQAALAEFTREQVRAGLAKAPGRHDRADWAIVRRDCGEIVGEAVLFELDDEHESMEYRIALVGPQAFDRGYGTEATMLVRDFAFGPLGLHRLTLQVAAGNERARQVYRRAGFQQEGLRRQARRLGEGWEDVLEMALIDSDPRPK
ncbi:MAG: GNAT family protein [Candidatus Phosphoribacter sp.]